MRRAGTSLGLVALALAGGVAAANRKVPNLLAKLRPLEDWSALGRSAGYTKLQGQRTAFIFMLDEGFQFPKLWESFFAAADPSAVKVLVHMKNREAASSLPSFFRGKVTATHTSEWCHLTHAQFALAREALRDPSVARVVWLSGDAVPLKGPRLVQAELLARPGKSVFCVDRPNERAEMWNVLARKHAEALLDAEPRLFAAFREFDTVCEDEDMFWGPLTLMGFEKELAEQCFMWTDWDATAVDRSPSGHTPSVSSAALLDMHLGPQGKADWLDAPWLRAISSNYKVWGGISHPWTFNAVPLNGLQRLVQDPSLWFARKFQETGRFFNGGVFAANGTRLGSLGEEMLRLVDFRGNGTRPAAGRAPAVAAARPAGPAAALDEGTSALGAAVRNARRLRDARRGPARGGDAGDSDLRSAVRRLRAAGKLRESGSHDLEEMALAARRLVAAEPARHTRAGPSP